MMGRSPSFLIDRPLGVCVVPRMEYWGDLQFLMQYAGEADINDSLSREKWLLTRESNGTLAPRLVVIFLSMCESGFALCPGRNL